MARFKTCYVQIVGLRIIYIYTYSKKSVLLIELTVPWEENQEAHERKKNRYMTLRADCVEKS